MQDSNVDLGAVQKRVDFADLVKSFRTSLFVLANIGVDTTEKWPSTISYFIPIQAL